jgi:hypothetical protein
MPERTKVHTSSTRDIPSTPVDRRLDVSGGMAVQYESAPLGPVTDTLVSRLAPKTNVYPAGVKAAKV